MVNIAQLGPLYWHPATKALALQVNDAHANVHGIAHGGLLATLIDCALGTYLVEETGQSVVTVQMSVDYLRKVQLGDWLEAHVEIDKQGSRLIYATCKLQVATRTVAKANAIFACMSDKAA